MTPESSSALAGLAALNHGILVEVRQLLRKEPKAMESHLAMMSNAADVLRDAPDSALDRAAHTGVCVMVVNKDYIERAIDGRSTPTPLPGFTAEGAQQILAINAALLNALDEFIRLEQSRAQIAFSAPPAICDMVRAVDPIAKGRLYNRLTQLFLPRYSTGDDIKRLLFGMDDPLCSGPAIAYLRSAKLN